jgi:choline kinase
LQKIIVLNKSNITIPILSNWKKIWKIRNKNPYKDAETLFVKKNMQLKSIGEKITNLKKIKYQFMGLIYIPKNKRNLVLSYYKKIKKKNNLHLTTFINNLVGKKITVDCINTKDNWYEFDDYEDYKNYKKNYL